MKKDKQYIKDFVFLILLIISFFFLTNPFNLIMTGEIEMVILAFVSLFIITILIFLWKEDPIDEREENHLLIAGRISFFSTAVILLTAIIIQTLQHNLDLWIPLSLCVLLSSKILTVLYLKYKK